MMKALAFQLTWNLPAVWKLLGQIEALLGEGGEAFSPSGDPHDLQTLRGLIAFFRGQEAFAKGQAARAITYSEEAFELLPEEWNYGRGNALLYWGFGMRATGRGDAAHRRLMDEYESLLWKTDPYAVRLLFAACFNCFELGDFAQTRVMAQMMLEQAPPDRLLVLRGWAHYFLGVAHYGWNELDAASQHFEAIVSRRYSVHAQTLRNGMIGLVRVHVARGEISEAWQMLELLSELDGERLGQEAEDARSLRAQLEALQGEADAALRWADAYTVPPPDRLLNWLQDPHLAKAQILLARGTAADVQAALAITAALNEFAERSFSIRFQIEVLALRALALERQGGVEDALAALRQAVELARPGGILRPFVDLGPRMQSLLLRLVESGFAAETVRRILAAFPAPGPQIATGDAGSALRAANAGLVEPLTRRELEVLALLRERLSNREIADRLCVSAVTVKRHTVNIYGKLGVSKRRDAVNKAEALQLLPPH